MMTLSPGRETVPRDAQDCRHLRGRGPGGQAVHPPERLRQSGYARAQLYKNTINVTNNALSR
jgi:hypothetical protein